MTDTATLSCLAIVAFVIVGLALLFYLLYRHKHGAAVITSLCLMFATCTFLAPPTRKQDARAPDLAAVTPAPSVTSPSAEHATDTPVMTTAPTPSATLDSATSTVSPTTT